MKTNEQRLDDLMNFIDSLSRINAADIPDINLYMDQVTTFMDSHLASSLKPGEEKALTKTMINNYAKNNLLPPPEKKKYSRNHILLLTFIYYFKNVLSLRDIEQLLSPISERCFAPGSRPELARLYEEIFSLEAEQRGRLVEDVKAKFTSAMETFSDENFPEFTEHADAGDREYLRLFAFVCELAFDVYLKKQMIELIAEDLRQEGNPNGKRKKDRK